MHSVREGIKHSLPFFLNLIDATLCFATDYLMGEKTRLALPQIFLMEKHIRVLSTLTITLMTSLKIG